VHAGCLFEIGGADGELEGWRLREAATRQPRERPPCLSAGYEQELMDSGRLREGRVVLHVALHRPTEMALAQAPHWWSSSARCAQIAEGGIGRRWIV
jgi:hypothetical protein